jgi:CHAT domain-containing protein
MPAALVVLSACEGASGRLTWNEGPNALAHGFLQAGARTVIASIWRAPDASTSKLMTLFYGELLGTGLRPAEALAAAQQSLRTIERWRHPYYWAGFGVYVREL